MSKEYIIQKVDVNGYGYSPKEGTRIYEEYKDFVLLNSERQLITKYSDDVLWDCYNKILKTPGKYDAVPFNNKITYHFFENFYHVERELWKDIKIQEKLYKNRKKYIGKTQETITNEELLRGFKISGIHVGYSHFCPYWFKAFIQEYNIKTCYDPCGGWGQRMLGTQNLDLYIYNDIWEESAYYAYLQKEYFHMNNVQIYNNDSAKFTPPYDYEAIFTSPPYENKEIYSEESIFKTYTDYLDWWKNTLIKSIKPSLKYIVFVLDNMNANGLIEITKEISGFELIKIQPVGRQLKSHMNKNKKEQENMYIFFKK